MIRRFLAALAVLAALSAVAQAQTITPQGRLTLTSGSPVLTADVTAATTVYYDSYLGNTVPVAGTNLTITSGEISMGLDAGVPHIASGSVYDIFAVNNSGSPALCAGPAWSTTTSRGTGAGTTELHQDSHGLWTNKNSLTHCWGGASGTTDFGAVSADAGTYLGSLYGTAAGQTGMQFGPNAASGGNNNFLALYNAYNQVQVRSFSQDSHANWTYATNTWRAAEGSNSNRITWLDGLRQSQVSASYAALAFESSGTPTAQVGVNFNSTSATPGGIIGDAAGLQAGAVTAFIAGGNTTTLLGLNYAQAMEIVTTATAGFGTSPQNGLTLTIRN